MRLAEAGPWWDEPVAATAVPEPPTPSWQRWKPTSPTPTACGVWCSAKPANNSPPKVPRDPGDGDPASTRVAEHPTRQRSGCRGVLSERAARALNRGTTSGVVGLAIAGFAMSYEALHSLAVEQGVPAPLAWLWPLVVDGFIVVASLSVVRTVADGRHAAYPWLLVLAFSSISVAFNVMHAAPTVVARFVAAIPPTALVLSFELLMRQLREQVSSNPVSQLRGTDTQLATSPTPTPPQLGTEQLARTAGRQNLLDKARHIHADQERRGTKLTGKALAALLGISDGYARRLLRAIDSEAA